LPDARGKGAALIGAHRAKSVVEGVGIVDARFHQRHHDLLSALLGTDADTGVLPVNVI